MFAQKIHNTEKTINKSIGSINMHDYLRMMETLIENGDHSEL